MNPGSIVHLVRMEGFQYLESLKNSCHTFVVVNFLNHHIFKILNLTYEFFPQKALNWFLLMRRIWF